MSLGSFQEVRAIGGVWMMGIAAIRTIFHHCYIAAAESSAEINSPAGGSLFERERVESKQPGTSDEPRPSASSYDPQKLYKVGTLVYTSTGLTLLFFWLLCGDFALALRDRSVGELIEKFLLKYGASNTLKQALTGTLPLIIGLFVGPIISYQSDRCRSRWGRRIPFLIIPTPIAGLAMIGIGFCPQIGEFFYTALGNVPPVGVPIEKAASAYTLAVFTGLITIFDVAVITSGAVMFGLINDVVPRSVLGRFHGMFRAVSLFDGILFNALLFKHAEEHFSLLFMGIGVVFAGGFSLMCLMVKEGQYPPPPEDPHMVKHGTGFVSWVLAFLKRFFSAAYTYLRECFANPYYLLYFAMITMAALTFKPINDFTYRYAMQLGISDADYGFLRALSYFVSLVLAFPLGMFVDKLHVIRMALIALVLYTLTALYGSFFVHDAKTFAIAFVAHTILSGTYFTCSASLGQQLLPRSKFSQYASAGGIIASLVGLIYAPSIGAVIDLTNSSDLMKKNYHITFWIALGFSVVTLILGFKLFRRFMSYGGPLGYVAPGDTDGAAARLDPPKHLLQILTLYFIGAGLGGVIGYVTSFFFQSHESTTLGDYPRLLMANKDVRDMAIFWIASAVVPGAIIGSIAGSTWAKRLSTRA